MGGDELLATLDQRDWVKLAEHVLAPHLEEIRQSGHVLTLFDAHGLMLSSAGDPSVLHRLDDIHFFPGADWSEASAGTNGPGTALVTHRPVHVVGREHYCEAWHPWHCAAVPVHTPCGDLLGALDLSGPADQADPHSLQLARALASCVEQALQGLGARRRALVLQRYAELAARYPGDLLVALDCEGAVLQASAAARARGLPERLRLPNLLSGQVKAPPQAAWLDGAAVHVVLDQGIRAGTCLVLRAPPKLHRRDARAPVRPGYRFQDVVGPGLRDTVELAQAASATDMPVLLLGESGVGKELLAQAIHAESPRAAGPFIAVNCAALPRDLVESELFGYGAGAFTGARGQGSPGRFVEANGGTLFLDEIGELPLPAQAALLRVVQDGVVSPLGAAPLRVDVRVVSATNRDLATAVHEGTFRLDLFHRLEVLLVKVPPLRERRGDISILIDHLSGLIEAESGLAVRLPLEVRAALERYDWPGNVRELENVLRRLAVLGSIKPVTVACLPFSPRTTPGADSQTDGLLEAIHATKNMAEAAARLGINRSTLYRKLDRQGLRPGRTARPGH